MATVYIVTSGEYSEYSINAVFDSKEKAQAFIDYVRTRTDQTFGWSDNPNIEEWILNEVSDPISRGLVNYVIQFNDIEQGNGDVLSYHNIEGDGVEASGEDKRPQYAGRRWYRTSVWAKDQTTALKIANERRVRAIVAIESGQS